MTREELLRDAEEARRLGDSNLELAILEKLDKLPQSKDRGFTDYAKNALLGASARGNQAFTALNPFATQEDIDRVEREKAWVEQNSGAGIGSTISDILMSLPAGGFTSLPARALASGAIEGMTTTGTIPEKIKTAGYSALGSGVGEKIGDAVGFVAKPFKKFVGKEYDNLVDVAKKHGITLNAADVTDNKFLKSIASGLDYIPSTSGRQQDFNQNKIQNWQRALFQQGNEHADSAVPDVMAAMDSRISGVYDDVTSRNALMVDKQLKDELSAIEKTYINDKIPTDVRGIIKSYIRDFKKPPIGAEIPGDTYQKIRSRLRARKKNFEASDTDTANALGEIKTAIDAAMKRSLNNPGRIGGNPDDAAKWAQADKDYMVKKQIENAIDDPVTGRINQNKLYANVLRENKRRMLYGKGDQEFTDLVKAGKKFMPPMSEGSPTAQRSQAIKLLTGANALTAGETGLITGLAATGNPLAAALTGVGIYGTQYALPRSIQKSFNKPNGYFATGYDLDKDVVEGLTRQKLISEILRNTGVQLGSQNAN